VDFDCLFDKLLAAPVFRSTPAREILRGSPPSYQTVVAVRFLVNSVGACGKVIQKLQQFARRMIRKFGLLNELNHLKTRFGCRGGQLRAEEFRFSQGYLGRTLKERSFCRSAGSCPRIELFWIKGSVSEPSRTRPVLASPARQTHRRCLGLRP